MNESSPILIRKLLGLIFLVGISAAIWLNVPINTSSFWPSNKDQSTSLEPKLVLQQFAGRTMGTFYQVKIGVPESMNLPGDELHQLKLKIEEHLERINTLMSTYKKDSELSRFNQFHSSDWFTISPETARVIAEALRLSKLTGGIFDPTVGPLVNLWGFGPNARPDIIPDESEISAKMKSVGFQKLELNEDGTHIRKTDPNLYVDLSSIAKGYGVDVISQYLSENGFKNHMEEIGGEIRASGLNIHGKPWTIGIESPGSQGRAERIIPLENNAIATSGNYRNFYEENGKSYSHAINPLTGKPVAHSLVSVSIVHSSTMIADALAKAVMVMGPEKGKEFCEQQQIAAFFVIKNQGNKFSQYSSVAFAKILPGATTSQDKG